MIDNKNFQNRARACYFLALFILARLLAASATAQTLTVLKSFEPNFINATGFYPKAKLIEGPNNTLYGTAYGGGVSGFGVVFKIQTAGSGFTVLWNFSGGSDGANPVAGLVLSGNTLYGTTFSGGASGFGTVFALNTDGSGFTNLYSFTGGSDGANSTAPLVLSDGTLYGTALDGGSAGFGTVFAVETNGSGFTNLYSFKGGTDCGNPYAGLLLSGGTLYGTTTGSNAAIADFGSVFKINTNGSGFAVLKTFVSSGDFANPFGGLVISGSTLYGTAAFGNNNEGYGTVFEINTNGGGFSTLHSFDFSDGDGPYGELVLSGGILYGTTFGGGADNYGTVFKIDTTGSGFSSLHSFTGGSDEGDPYAGLLLVGSTLYGTASAVYVSSANGFGTIFEINTSGSDFIKLYTFASTDGSDPSGGLVLSGGTLYGTTYAGGASNDGTVFSVNTSGTGFTTLHSFAGYPSDGANPYAGLTLGSDGNFYGTTYGGGASDGGTVFQITTSDRFTRLVSFANTDGAAPFAGLTLGSNGNFYGTTAAGGPSTVGTVFQMKTNGTLATLVLFAYTNGANPYAGLTLGGDGNFYGTTYSGGNSGYGTVFQITTNGTLTTLVSFANTNGANPYAGLTLGSDGNFYGTTYGGGSSGEGTVFRVTTNGALSTLASFAGTNGASPYAGLTLGSDGNFYGTTSGGGSSYDGTVFQITTNGTLATLVSFDYTDGAQPEAALTLGGDGNFYGTTSSGGSSGSGTVFRLSPQAPFIISQPPSQVVPEGANVVIDASVFGALPLFYQWTFNATNLPGETNASLMLTNVSLSEAGGYAFQVSNTLGVASSGDAVLSVVAAVATTLPAGNVSTSGAMLNGSVTLGSNGTSVWFEWGTGTNYGNVTATTLLPGNDESTNVSAVLSGLVGNIYYYRIAVSNDLGIVFGGDQVFTVGLAPTATTLPVNVSTNGATLNATVNPNGWETTVYFRWGLSALTNLTPVIDVAAGTNSLNVNSFITGLVSSKTYYFQAVASNYLGVAYGAEESFVIYGPPFVDVPNANWDSVASSADGSVLVAVSNPGGSYPETPGLIYISTNSGAEWNQATNAPNGQWETVACSADGSRIIVGNGAGGSAPGPVYTSPDTGVSWVQSDLPTLAWQSVASSADGSNLVAAAYIPGGSNSIYASSDAGSTWAQLTNAPKLGWYSIALSADGSKLAAVAAGNTNIYTSTNFGATWITNKVPKGLEGAQSEWTTIASSADGSRLVAAGGGTFGSGYIFISTNFGAAWTLTATNLQPSHGYSEWIYVASSADGSKLAAVSELGAPGGVITSTNAGATWKTNSVPAVNEPTWNSVALSADGASMVVSVGYPNNSGPIYTSHTMPSPVLNLAAFGGNLMLSWLIPSKNLGLQQNSDLTTTNWTDVTNLPVLNLTNLQNQVVLPPPDGTSFFRLKY